MVSLDRAITGRRARAAETGEGVKPWLISTSPRRAVSSAGPPDERPVVRFPTGSAPSVEHIRLSVIASLRWPGDHPARPCSASIVLGAAAVLDAAVRWCRGSRTARDHLAPAASFG